MLIPALAILAIIGGLGGIIYIIVDEYKKYEPPVEVTHYEHFCFEDENTLYYPQRVGIDIYA